MLTTNFLDIDEILQITTEGKDRKQQALYEKCNMFIDFAMQRILEVAEEGCSLLYIEHKDCFHITKNAKEFTSILTISHEHLNKHTLFSFYKEYNENEEEYFSKVSWLDYNVEQKIKNKQEEKIKKQEIDKLLKFKCKTIISRLLIKDSNGKYYIRTSKCTIDMVISPKTNKGYINKCFKANQYYLTSNKVTVNSLYGIVASSDGRIVDDYVSTVDVSDMRMFRPLGW